jgi:hypothetical protein
MVQIHISDIITSFQDSNILWIIIPIFFVGIITDKYQEEFGTSLGNAISNGALIIFTAFTWLQLISARGSEFPVDITISQLIFTLFIISYGFAIVASGFKSAEFAKVYGRIRVITFMLVFFTIMVYIPLFYNFISIVLFVLLFPFYYAFITELIKVLPSVGSESKNSITLRYQAKFENLTKKSKLDIAKEKFREYLR